VLWILNNENSTCSIGKGRVKGELRICGLLEKLAKLFPVGVCKHTLEVITFYIRNLFFAQLL
jgi:hypothetical protein